MLDDFASVVDDRRNDEALRTPATATEDAGSAPCRNMHQHHLLGAALLTRCLRDSGKCYACRGVLWSTSPP